MNLQYLRYALEISRTGSISKAAENLSVAQPNLSRAVKELEASLGISIFERTRTGMTVTPEGEKLLSAGDRILRQVDELETMFDGEKQVRERLSVCAAPAAYLFHAFLSFCAALPKEGLYEAHLEERELGDTLEAVTLGTAKLGIIRIPLHFEKYYTDKLTERELAWETVLDFTPVYLAGAESSLARHEMVTHTAPEELSPLISPESLPIHDDTVSRGDASCPKEITVTDRAAAYGLLAADSSLCLVAPPMPASVASQYGLIQRPAAGNTRYRDLLIRRKDYRLTATDEAFLRALRGTARSLGDN